MIRYSVIDADAIAFGRSPGYCGAQTMLVPSNSAGRVQVAALEQAQEPSPLHVSPRPASLHSASLEQPHLWLTALQLAYAPPSTSHA